MNGHDAWEGVDVLIPQKVHQKRRQAVQAACLDVGALIGALPGTSPAPQDGASRPRRLQGLDRACDPCAANPNRHGGHRWRCLTA